MDQTRTTARLLTLGEQCFRNAICPKELALHGEVYQGFVYVCMEVAVVLNIYIFRIINCIPT